MLQRTTALLTRRSARRVHVGVLQVFKLQHMPTPRGGEPLRMLFPSGLPESTDESAAALAAAADRGEPMLVTVSVLRSLLQEQHAALPQLTSGDGPALLGAADDGIGGEAEGEGNSSGALTAAAADALMTQDSVPLADVLAAGAEHPDWSRTVAREHVAPPEPTELQRSLMHAASVGDAEELSRLIAEAPAQAVRDAALPPSGGSALHLASASGSLQAVQALIGAGCSVHARAANGSTPLHWAAGGGHADVVRALLRAGADSRARSSTWRSTVRGDASGQTAAHWAASGGHTEALEELVSADPYNLALADERDLSPASVAAREGHGWLESALTDLQQQPVVCVRVQREMTLQRPLSPARREDE